MADDLDDLLDEVETKFCVKDKAKKTEQAESTKRQTQPKPM